MDSVYNIETLLPNAAEAVVTNQQLLDRALGKAYLASCQADGFRTLFTIPRAHVRLRFGVVETSSGGWRLVPFKWLFNEEKNVREQMHTHEIQFFVDATPTAPLAVESESPQTSIPLYLSVPYFMLSFSEEADVAKRLMAALANASWTSAIPGEVDDLDGKVKRELKRFQEAWNNNGNEQGPIFFRFDSNPVSYLVVRVVGSNANDSIFVVTPGQQPEVVIHSMDGDDVQKLRYQPLRQLLDTIRRSQMGRLPQRVSSEIDESVVGPSQAENGLRALLPLARDIREGYAKGLKYLSTSYSASLPGAGAPTPNVYFDLTSVEASLKYSVGARPANGGPPRMFDFMLRRPWGDPDTTIQSEDDANEARLIESRAFIRAFRRAGKAQVEIELQTPEFVLTGDARRRLLSLALNSVDVISEAFAPEQAIYEGFIRDPDSSRNVVALLSYRGEQAKDKFFIVWPGLRENQPHDFAFICALDKDKPTRLKDIKAVVRVVDDLDAVEVSTVTAEQYRAFHNFFHAVRMWRVRMTT